MTADIVQALALAAALAAILNLIRQTRKDRT